MTGREPSVLAPDQLNQARRVIASSRFLPFRFLDSERADLVSLCVDEIAGLAARFGGVAFSVSEGGGIAALTVVADLPWESTVLGRRMAALKHVIIDPETTGRDAVAHDMVRGAVEWAAARSVDCLLCKVYTDDREVIGALQRNGFMLVETALDYVFDCHRDLSSLKVDGDGRVAIRQAEAGDLDGVLGVVRAAFQTHVGRFHSDPKLSPEEATRIYEEWIRSSFNGYADAIFVADNGGRIAGFSIWKQPSPSELSAGLQSAHYSIGATDPADRNRGVFRALTLAGMKLYRGSAEVIEGPTNLRNIPVQRAYQALGWELRDSRYTFHRWRTSS